MDYAAALRASPTGPAVRLDTTPTQKAPLQKAPVPKPVKVEVEEPVHVVEEETAPSVAIASAPAKAPTNAGLSPTVRFVITVPVSSSTHKDAAAGTSETNGENSESGSDAEEDANGEVVANGAKSNKQGSSHDGITHHFSAQDLETVRTTAQYSSLHFTSL